MVGGLSKAKGMTERLQKEIRMLSKIENINVERPKEELILTAARNIYKKPE